MVPKENFTNDVSPGVGVALVRRRQTDGIDGLVDGHGSVGLQDGNVVLERLRVVALVGADGLYLVVHVQSLAHLVEVVLADPESDVLLFEAG